MECRRWAELISLCRTNISMKTLILKAEVQAEGHMRLDIPCEMPPGVVDVCVTIQAEHGEGEKPGPNFSTFEGSMAGQFPEGLDVEAILVEMSREWQKSLVPE